jgi:hypothetical protein
MPTEIEITNALVATLATITGLRALHYPEPNMSGAICFPLLEQDFNVDLGSDDGGNSGPLEGELMLCTPWGAGLSRAGAQLLGQFLAAEGDQSVNQLLHGSTLGDVVQSVQVRGMKKLEMITFPDGRAYWARALRIRIYP